MNTTGITFSAFDLLHAGHITMLREARQHCDHLTAALHADPSIDRTNKNKPIQSLLERQLQLQACAYVDQIVVYETEQDIVDLLHILRPGIRIIGEEYKHQDFSGKAACKQLGIRIVYNSRNHHWSSSELRKRVAHQEFVRFNQP